MRRFAFLASCLISIAAACPVLSLGSEDTRQISLRVARGWARQADGSRRDLTGMVFPATIERIEARPVSLKHAIKNKIRRDLKKTPFGRFMDQVNAPILGPAPNASSYLSSTTIYQADAGSGYAYIDPEEFDDPSSLDDLATVAGGGKQWETLQFGFHVESVPAFVFVNWEGFATYNSSTPDPASAFTNSFVDFAVLLLSSDVPGPGTWKLTINVTAANAVSPNNTMYVSQQFWQDNEQNFQTAYRNVYNAGATPSIGSSQNQFWFDWDPLNNVFTNNEVDVLSGEGTFSNHLRTITAADSGGTTDTIRPLTYTVVQGRNATGTVNDLWTSNNVYVALQPSLFAQSGVPPLQVSVEGFAEAPNAITLKFKVEAASLNGGSTQRIRLWNYNTNVYDLVDTRAAPSSDGVTEVTISSNAARYIHPTDLNVKAIMQYTPGVFTTSTWRVQFDQTIWTITR